MNSSSVSMVLWTTDISALAAFFIDIAGGALVSQHPGYALLDLGGFELALQGDEASPDHPWFHALNSEGATRGLGMELRLSVEDVVAGHAAAERSGAVTVLPPYDAGETRECQVMGPDGYLVTFWQANSDSLPPIVSAGRRSAFGRVPASRNTVVRRW